MTDILDNLNIPEDKKADIRAQAKTAAEQSVERSDTVYEATLQRLALSWLMRNAKPATVKRGKQGFRHTKTLPSRLWKSGRKR